MAPTQIDSHLRPVWAWGVAWICQNKGMRALEPETILSCQTPQRAYSCLIYLFFFHSGFPSTYNYLKWQKISRDERLKVSIYPLWGFGIIKWKPKPSLFFWLSSSAAMIFSSPSCLLHTNTRSPRVSRVLIYTQPYTLTNPCTSTLSRTLALPYMYPQNCRSHSHSVTQIHSSHTSTHTPIHLLSHTFTHSHTVRHTLSNTLTYLCKHTPSHILLLTFALFVYMFHLPWGDHLPIILMCLVGYWMFKNFQKKILYYSRRKK